MKENGKANKHFNNLSKVFERSMFAQITAFFSFFIIFRIQIMFMTIIK